jgi:hypothetical protein
LTKNRERAKRALAFNADNEPAWSALGDYYHNEAAFMCAFEFLSMEKVPQWLEEPVSKERLFAAFGGARWGGGR